MGPLCSRWYEGGENREHGKGDITRISGGNSSNLSRESISWNTAPYFLNGMQDGL